MTRTREHADSRRAQLRRFGCRGAEAATTTRTFDYDASGNITTAGTVGGDNTYTWNDRGLLASSSGPGGNASFGYDSDGRLQTRTDGAGSTTFTYTDAGRLRTATDPLVSKTLTYTYRPTSDYPAATRGPSPQHAYDHVFPAVASRRSPRPSLAGLRT